LGRSPCRARSPTDKNYQFHSVLGDFNIGASPWGSDPMNRPTFQYFPPEKHNRPVKSFLAKAKDIALAGFFFLMPVYVVFIVITKAWTSFSSVGAKVAGMFGMKSILGVNGSTVASGLILTVIWVACGLLVQLSFVAAFHRAVEERLAAYIPGYDTYKQMAEEKLHKKAKILPYTSALVRQQEYWQPGYVVEQDDDGNYVVFLPSSPDTTFGHVLLAKREQVRVVSAVPANKLDESMKKMGKGFLDLEAVRDAVSLPQMQASHSALPLAVVASSVKRTETGLVK
jgi:uncharacterized membrane protein